MSAPSAAKFTREEIEQLYKIALDGAGLHHLKGSEYRSCCILHGGDNPSSLSVNTETGRFCCFSCGAKGSSIYAFAQELLRRESPSGQAPEAGAVTQWIRAALGTPFSERVYPEDIGLTTSSGKGWDRNLAQGSYLYTDELGAEVYRVWRFVDAHGNKTTPVDHPCEGVRAWGMKGIRRVLYHLLDVLQCILIFIVEGEKNVDDLSRALALYISRHGGFHLGKLILDRVAVTTNVGGANGWKQEYDYGKFFVGKIVVKLGDKDEAGRKHNEAVCRDVFRHASQLFTLDLPVGEGEDISDYLRQHSIEDLIQILDSDRKLYVAPSSYHIGPELVCLADVEAKPVPWLWRPYLAFSMLAMLSGDPSAGKTFIALGIAAALSNGRIPVTGELCEVVSTLYLSHENAAEYVVRPRFDAQGGNPSRFHMLRGSIAGDDEHAVREGITLRDVAIIEAALVETGAKLVIIDPIQSYLGAEVDAHRSNETRPVMDGLIRLAEKYGACVLIVRHLAKASGGRAIHRGLGSIDLTGAVRTEMLAGTAPEDPDRRALVQIKNNLGPMANSLGYEIVGDEMGAHLNWSGTSDLTAADLLAPDAEGEGRSDRAEAEDYIRAQLASGPKLLRDLTSASGIAEWTLQRAAKKVGITRSRDGERGPWIWALEVHTRQKSAYATTQCTVAYAENCRARSEPVQEPPVGNGAHAASIDPDELSTEGEEQAQVPAEDKDWL